MMGFMGDYLGDTSWDDKFFTPLNKTIGVAPILICLAWWCMQILCL